MNIRSWTATITVSLCTLTATASLGATAASAETCPNEQFRTGFSAYLPDCRAYELVTPQGIEPSVRSVGSWGDNIYQDRVARDEIFGIKAAANGERLAFESPYSPLGFSKEGVNYLMIRGADGWSTESIVPPQSTTNSGAICYNAYAPAYTPDMTAWVFADGWDQTAMKYKSLSKHGCGRDEPELIPDEPGHLEPETFQNLFLRSAEGGYRLIDLTPLGAPGDAWYQAGSEDLSKVVFTDAAQLTPEAPESPPIEESFPREDLYVWSAGTVRLVTVLPNGSATWGSLAYASEPNSTTKFESGVEAFTHVVSSDGSRVFFYANGDLYMREHPDQPQSALGGKEECTEADKACTVQIDVSKIGGPGGGGRFGWASADGSRVFFTDEPTEELTKDTEAGSGANLYEYDVESGALTDLTPVADARVEGLSGASADGSYVYFVALGAIPGSGQNGHGASATAGMPNLYLVHGGVTTFIATLEPSSTNQGDRCDWVVYCQTTRVSETGQFLVFNSVGRPTGYDNTDAGNGQADQEIYLYDATENALNCVSCDPTGAQPTAPAHIPKPSQYLVGQGSSAVPTYLQHSVTDQGQVFFDTAESLVPQDSNGQGDVYEYEHDELHLLSSGTSGTPSIFLDASASGDDVFFVGGQALVPYSNAAVRTYDARVDGGFPEPGGITACSEEDCKGAVTATPLLAAPSSQTFVGPGNPVSPQAVHGFARKASKPKAKKRKRRRRRAKKSSHGNRSVRGGRGGVK